MAVEIHNSKLCIQDQIVSDSRVFKHIIHFTYSCFNGNKLLHNAFTHAQKEKVILVFGILRKVSEMSLNEEAFERVPSFLTYLKQGLNIFK